MYKDIVDGFLHKHSLQKTVAIIGGFIESDIGKVTFFLREFYQTLAVYPLAIVTGGTDWGLPGLATKLAGQCHLKVIGILPQTGEKDKAAGLDLELIVPSIYGSSHYGDETPVLVKASHALVSVGGMFGAGTELFHACKVAQDLLRKKKEPLHIVPLAQFGGITDMFLESRVVRYAAEWMSPLFTFQNGGLAAEYLLEKFGFI